MNGPRFSDLEIYMYTPTEWVIRWKRGGPVVQAGFTSQQAASDALCECYDDCD